MARKAESKRYKEIRNTRATHDFHIDEKLECGIILVGTEVKSLRSGLAQIKDAFVRFDKKIPTLYHAHIAEYAFGNLANHKPLRPRRLLMNKREITRWMHEVQAGGKTIIPLRIYFKKGLAKVEIALARGKKTYDKRQDVKEREDLRETQRMMRQHLSDR